MNSGLGNRQFTLRLLFTLVCLYALYFAIARWSQMPVSDTFVVLVPLTYLNSVGYYFYRAAQHS